MIEYVEVIGKFEKNGDILPLCIVWHNGVKYKIERILQRCPANSLKANKKGMRYTCVIQNQRRYLYYDQNRWFIERVN